MDRKRQRSRCGADGSSLTTRPLRAIRRLTRNVTVPVSAGLLTDTDAYFTALDGYRAGDPLAIIVQFARAAFAAIDNGRRLIVDLRAIRQGWDDTVQVRKGAATWRVADLLVRRPVINAALIASELGIAPQNSYRSLRPLVDAGTVVEFSDKKRNQLWRAPGVLGALDRFAARAGRRTSAAR